MIFPIKHTDDAKQKSQSCEAELAANLESSYYSDGNIYLIGYGQDRKQATESLREQLLQLQQDLTETSAAIDTELGVVDCADVGFMKAFRAEQAAGAEKRDQNAALQNTKFVHETLAFVKRMLMSDAAAGATETAFSFKTETEFNIAKHFAVSNGFTYSVPDPGPSSVPVFLFPKLYYINISHGSAAVTP
jgi:hypothetical protein